MRSVESTYFTKFESRNQPNNSVNINNWLPRLIFIYLSTYSITFESFNGSLLSAG